MILVRFHHFVGVNLETLFTHFEADPHTGDGLRCHHCFFERVNYVCLVRPRVFNTIQFHPQPVEVLIFDEILKLFFFILVNAHASDHGQPELFVHTQLDIEFLVIRRRKVV